MPKPICSPARHSDSSKRHHNHDLKKISTRIGGVQAQSSPLLWAKSKNSEIISEPTSPKVTCAGQIKVRPKQGSSCKNWQSVMEEIEKLHNRKAQKKKGANWMEAIGIKKDVMQFLTCLRNIRFEFRCFGSFPTTTHDITSDDEEEEDDGDELERRGMNQIGRDLNDREDDDDDDEEESSKTVFSKWFMVLQDENQKTELTKTEHDNNNDDDDNVPICVPPPNALLLMRCRSAPPKSWLQETQQVQKEEEERRGEDNEEEKKAKSTMEEVENKKKNENLVVMGYGNNFHKFSADIAKETWVVGGVRDQLAKSRSWKR
uniref:Putative kinesin-related protein 4-like n=1 Tax=Solanum chacoense TaxID=4108 RepID=A0A0V0I2L0_SOLCH